MCGADKSSSPGAARTVKVASSPIRPLPCSALTSRALRPGHGHAPENRKVWPSASWSRSALPFEMEAMLPFMCCYFRKRCAIHGGGAAIYGVAVDVSGGRRQAAGEHPRNDRKGRGQARCGMRLASRAIAVRVSYAIPSTNIASRAMCLRACFAIPRTGMMNGAMCLRHSYAISRTDAGVAAVLT